MHGVYFSQFSEKWLGWFCELVHETIAIVFGYILACRFEVPNYTWLYTTSENVNGGLFADNYIS